MIEGLRNWIVTICTAVIFIAAVEMVLPNNSFKKYAKFVLGLILMTILLNPIIKIFDKNYSIDSYTNEAFKYFNEGNYKTDLEKSKENSMSRTLSTFKLNLENECEKMLKEKFSKGNYNVEAVVDYDDEAQAVFIKSLKIGVKDGSIDRVKKVDVSTKGSVDNNSNTLNDERSRLIKEYLANELKVDTRTIDVYKN